MALTNEDFKLWKEFEVTKMLFSALNQEKGRIERDMLSSGFILREGAQALLAQLSGKRDMIDLVLNMSAGDSK